MAQPRRRLGARGPRAAWDIFICHASEDKAEIAKPLAMALTRRGLSVWYDEFALRLGDSLRRSIDRGIANSRYGVVILSPSFFRKHWPQLELDALLGKETLKRKTLLPVWHNVTVAHVRRFSPILAEKFAVSTDGGVRRVADAIVDTFKVNVQSSRRRLRAKPVSARSDKVATSEPSGIEYSQYGNRLKGWSEVRFSLRRAHVVKFEWEFSPPLGTDYLLSVDGKVETRRRVGLVWNDFHHTFTLENTTCLFRLRSRLGDGTAMLRVGDTWLWADDE